MPNERILLIDDSPEVLKGLSEYLNQKGYEVQTAADGSVGIPLIRENAFDIVLTDLMMPGADGMAVLEYIKQHSSDSTCIILTGYGSIKNAVEAIKRGAFDYLTKPVKLEEIGITLTRALEFRRLKRENLNLRNQLKRKYQFKNILGESPVMQRVFATMEKVADSDSTVLILGDSGTGKELIARALHYNSSRREGPLIPINCAAIPSELLESELFGHEKGAFTGAFKTRIGRFELADGGTLFLDEIGDMNPSLQGKLLRVIQERQFERIGGMKPIKVDIRIISATHQDLKLSVAEKRFREDLYYRLNVIPIEIPPLRERKSDIPLLVNHFIHYFSRTKKKKVDGMSGEALDALENYDWPGNVRELENMIERLVILSSDDVIHLSELPERILSYQSPPQPRNALPVQAEGFSLECALGDFERQMIFQALERSGWVKNKAAQLLGMNRTTLIEKIKRLDIRRPAP